MSLRFNPDEIPSVEQRDENEYFCSMCRTFFDHEAFVETRGCPGCQHMSDFEQKMQAKGHRGAL